ncbi:MAG TPA: hypothetical protein VI636_07200 [Candidatus Angelobacter sp.]
MSNPNDDRVLSRKGARELSPQELECVSGSFQRSNLPVCSFNPLTCQLDGPFPCKPPEVNCIG